MTKEQVKKYNDIEKEIQPLRAIMNLCGDKYRIKSLNSGWRMIMYTAKKLLHLRCNEPNCIEYCIEYSAAIPKELQTEIVAVIENYIERREKEMEEL